MPAPRSVLVFGSSGFVGGYLVRELRGHGYEVYGSDRGRAPSDAGLDAYRACDVTDAAAVGRVVEELRPGAIVNLAAVSSVAQSWREPQATMSVNVVGAVNVLEAARRMGEPPEVLLVGSSEEYAPSDGPLKETDPIDAASPYGVSKVAQERLAEVYGERYGLRVYRARSFNHTGVGQSPAFVLPGWCRQVAEIQRSGVPGAVRVGNLDVSRDFSDVRDIVRGYRMLLESGFHGEAFNFGSGRAVPLRDLLRLVTSFADVEVSVEVDPELLRPADNPYVCADCSKARRLLSWEPEHRAEDALTAMYAHCLVSEA